MLEQSPAPSPKLIDIAVEASWLTEKWEYLENLLETKLGHSEPSYEIDLGRALSALRSQNMATFHAAIKSARQYVVKGLSHSNTGNLDQCHPNMLKLHALFEVESISSAFEQGEFNQPNAKEAFMARLQRRFDLLGASAKDKEYILAIRRAVFGLSNLEAVKRDLATTWLVTARLARKAGRVQQAFHAILKSSKLGEQSATVEHARLLWREGQHRKAIQSLQGIIDAKVLNATNVSSSESEMSIEIKETPQNSALAKVGNLFHLCV